MLEYWKIRRAVRVLEVGACEMCGFAGIFAPQRGGASRAQAERMARVLNHRGPDSQGNWQDESGRVVFSFRRLAILDRSEAANQPMESSSGRYCIVYNGEIYNYRELRKRLRRLGHGFDTHSDTEVLLAAVEEWGLSSTIKRLNGMFAFGLWDASEENLSLARDRIGIKPLYYCQMNDGRVIFASELGALEEYETFDSREDPTARQLYLRFGYIPAPFSIYAGAQKLQPGHVLTADASARKGKESVQRYWSLKSAVRSGREQEYAGPVESAVDEVGELIRDAVRLRTVSDVPIGAFLSGGIDSSLVAALMQSCTPERIRTFTVGFGGEQYDESRFARQVGEHLGSQHREYNVSEADLLKIVPELATIYGEPFSDSSQIPTVMLSRLVGKEITVVLSGDGGDELFGGYDRYDRAQTAARILESVPGELRLKLSRILSVMASSSVASELLRVLAALSEGRTWRGDAVQKIADIIACQTTDELHDELRSVWSSEHLTGGRGIDLPLGQGTDDLEGLSRSERFMYRDAITYLPGDVLTKVDRASMSVGLEVRVPLLDHRVVEAAWSLPIGLKRKQGKSKWILRKILNKYVSSEIVNRPKHGFNVPLQRWLRGPLRGWAQDLLNSQGNRIVPEIDSSAIRRCWNELESGRSDWSAQLWNILMYISWKRK